MDEYEENNCYEHPICVTINCSEEAKARERLKKCCEQFDILMSNLTSKRSVDRRK